MSKTLRSIRYAVVISIFFLPRINAFGEVSSSGITPDGFFDVSKMYFCADGVKITAIRGNERIPDSLRKSINSARWTKGQHKLPLDIFGYEFDLNGDGIKELIMRTGEVDKDARSHYLVVRVDQEEPEIIAAFQDDFGLVKREDGWDYLVVVSADGSGKRSAVSLQFDGKNYRQSQRSGHATKESEPK